MQILNVSTYAYPESPKITSFSICFFAVVGDRWADLPA